MFLEGNRYSFHTEFLSSVSFAADTDNDGLEDAVETNTGVYLNLGNTGTNLNIADSDTIA